LSSFRMFPFITKTWNPVVGCMHGCTYCWARKLAKGKLRKTSRYKNGFGPQFIEKELDKYFTAKDFVFVSDMGDVFGDWVPGGWIKDVLNRISTMSAKFLLLTKNPRRYLTFHPKIPDNCVLGCTIESSNNYPEISKAPSQNERLFWMTELAEIMNIRRKAGKPWNELFVCIEPILDFDLDKFANMLANWIKPWAVAVGYDNYNNHLPEPSLAKTMQLIDRLEKAGITVYRKTLREAWNERKIG